MINIEFRIEDIPLHFSVVDDVVYVQDIDALGVYLLSGGTCMWSELESYGLTKEILREVIGGKGLILSDSNDTYSTEIDNDS